MALLGAWRYSRGPRSGPLATLRVLCRENWLSNERLESFARRRNVSLQVYTYKQPGEFIRQMANADGHVDLLCTSSLLLRSLARSQWIRRLDYGQMKNAPEVDADFLHLPYDPRAEFAVPLFWNQYVVVAKSTAKTDDLADYKVSDPKTAIRLWPDELNLLQLVHVGPGHVPREVESEEAKIALLKALKSLVPANGKLLSDLKFDGVAQVPLAQVADQLGEAPIYHFSLPDEGAAMELGLLAVGEKAAHPRLAYDLIDELLTPDHARELHARVRSGYVHRQFDNDTSIPVWQRPQALRRLELTRLQFPDLDTDTLPRFEHALEALKILLREH